MHDPFSAGTQHGRGILSTMRRVLLAVASLLVGTGALGLVTTSVQPAARARENAVAFMTKRVGGPAETVPRTGFDGSSPPSVRLAAAGDVGTGGPPEYRTAAAMHAVGRDRPFDGLVLLGDNVYPSGDPARLDATVFRPFGPVLASGTTLVPVLGNHDVQNANGEGQIQALGMPGRWYARRFGPVLVVALDATRADDPAQRAWLERTLASATEEWKIAVMHFPPYSAGWHGSHEATRAAFTPLFGRYGVKLALSGHDHDYQRSRSVNGVTYVVSGGAAKLRKAGRADFTSTSTSTYHFVDIAVWPERLRLQAIDQAGRVFDTVTVGR